MRHAVHVTAPQEFEAPQIKAVGAGLKINPCGRALGPPSQGHRTAPGKWCTGMVHNYGEPGKWCTIMVHGNGTQLWCTGVVHNYGAREWCTRIKGSSGMVHHNMVHIKNTFFVYVMSKEKIVKKSSGI